MRLVFLDSTYPDVAKRVYRAQPALAGSAWMGQRDALLATEFGCWDSWAQACRYHGADAQELIVGVPDLDASMRMADVIGAMASDAVIVFRDPCRETPDSIAEWRRRGARACVAMVSSAAPSDEQLAAYDLVATAFPHYATAMKDRGLRVEYLPLAFDPRRLRNHAADGTEIESRGDEPSRPWLLRGSPVTFVGGLGIARHWRAGQHAVCAVAEEVGDAFAWYGYMGGDEVPKQLQRRFKGAAWGRDYFAVLGRSRVTLNRHGEVHTSPRADGRGAEWWACNMRLFEATGMGACLVTEAATNLRQFFEPWEECVPFGDPREAAQSVRWLLDHDDRAQAIAEAGQRRCLAQHTYRHRAAVLLDWLEALA